MNTKIYYLLIFLLGCINTPLLGQEKNDDGHDHADFFCGDTIHGIPNLPILIEECEQSTVITSLQEDGVTGTIVYGALEATQIKIIPGHTFVKIVAPTNDVTRRHTTTRFRRRNRGRSVKESNATITEAILPIKKKDNEFAKNIKIFPNPIQNKVQMNSPVYSITGYEITNQYGKIVKREIITPAKNQTLSLSELSKGLYVITLQLENNTVYRKTIIKH